MADTPRRRRTPTDPTLTRKESDKAAQERYRSTERYQNAAWASHLKRKYNLTVDDYASLLVSQGYSCKICGIQKTDRGWKMKTQRIDLFVDHCHASGRVRGLLCHKCNAGLGMFNENPDHLAGAIAYLKENSLG